MAPKMLNVVKFFLWAMLISGLVRGGSGGLADPPEILEPVEKKLEIDILS